MEIYTVDSDFLVKIWKFHYDDISGDCEKTVIITPTERGAQLMSESDSFKNAMARGDVNLGFIKRKIQSCTIYEHTSN